MFAAAKSSRIFAAISYSPKSRKIVGINKPKVILDTIRFKAYAKAYAEENCDKEWSVWANLLTKEIKLEITPELAKKSNKFNDIKGQR